MLRSYRPLLALVLAIAVRAWAGEHPVPLEKNVDAAKCLECHEDKTKGPHVHSAIATGCITCHEVKVVDKDTTNVDLIAPKEELCFTCHEKSQAATLHGPYEKGRCVYCHDPHVSDFDNQLRAAGNSLCLECHQNRKIGGNLALFKTSYELTEEEFQQIPKIGLDPTLKFGHPMGNHKVADDPNPLKPGEKISCLTCHDNHAADREKLVRTTEYKGKKMDVCDACHSANDEMRMAEAQKRTDEQVAQREKEQKALGKQPDVMPRRTPKPGKQP
jgi:predicted CXXCH cytochrome family protein